LFKLVEDSIFVDTESVKSKTIQAKKTLQTAFCDLDASITAKGFPFSNSVIDDIEMGIN